MLEPPRREVPCCGRCHGSGHEPLAAAGVLCSLCGGEGYSPGQVPMTREEALKVYKGGA